MLSLRTKLPLLAKPRLKQAVEVPEHIYTLNTALTELEGFNHDNFSATLAATYQAIQSDQPDLPSLLELINHNLRQYEAITYLLTDEQLGLIFDGLLIAKSTRIKTKKTKKTTAQIQNQVAKEGGLDLGAL